MKRSIRTQISLGFALIILATVALISLVSNLLITREFESYIAKQQEAFSEELAAGIAAQYSEEGGWNVDYIHGMGMYALSDGYVIKVTDANGVVVWDAENHDMEQCRQMMEEIEERMRALSNNRGEFVTHTYSLDVDGRSVGSADVTFYTPYYFNDNAFRFVDSLNLILLALGVVSMIGAVCVGIIFSRRISRPVVRVTEVADEIARGNYAVRADRTKGADELQALSASINHMAEQIDRAERVRKQLTSDVAHELRTPLANLSAQLEVILEGVFEPTEERLQGIYDEVIRLSSLVSDLEKLQQIENAVPEKSEFDLYDVALAVKQSFEAECGRAGLRCTATGDSVRVFADRNKITQVATNLLSNAIKYSHAGGAIEIGVRADGGDAVLWVKDEGIGIPESERSLIFERFYRADKSRNRKTGGVGIGLAIADAIVKAHGGRIEVESEEGKGSTFAVYLPVASDGEK